MAIQLELIKSIPYFSGLSSAELDSVKVLISERQAERGEFILLESETADRLYFVISGIVKVFKTSAEGKEQILQLIRPGDSFNDVPIFDGGPNPASAQAMGPVVLYSIKKSDISSMMRNHPQVALNVAQVLSQKLRNLVSLVEDLSFKHVTARLAKILLEYAGDGSAPRQRLTQQEMAGIAGTAREIIGRSLKELEGEGVIRLDHHRIVITDKEALRRMAGLVT
jgi:CRP/FNR family transcriptional regulator